MDTSLSRITSIVSKIPHYFKNSRKFFLGLCYDIQKTINGGGGDGASVMAANA